MGWLSGSIASRFKSELAARVTVGLLDISTSTVRSGIRLTRVFFSTLLDRDDDRRKARLLVVSHS